MRLVCTGCGTRYQIDDAIVRGKLVRLRCKHCATILEARLRDPRGGRAGPPAPPPRRTEADSSAAAPEPASRAPEPAAETAARAPEPAGAEWFLSVEGRLRGPMSPAELRQSVRRREAGADDLVWSPGFGGWRPIASVEEIRTALAEPARAPRHQPPPVPGARTASTGSSVLQLITPVERAAGAAAPAVATLPQPVLAPPLAQAAPALAPQPAPPIAAGSRWPLAVALLGGVSLALTSALVMVLREHNLHAPAEVERPAPRTQLHVGSPEVEREPDLPPPAGREASSLPVTTKLPAVEVRGRRERAAPTEANPKRERLEARVDDQKTALAAQILRHNRASLTACDRLAERRGEILRAGARAEFLVRVEADGRALVQVSGQGLSALTLSCYRSVATEWRLPQTGAAYSTAFAHVH